MADSKQRTVRKGHIYYVKIAEMEYRAFIWEAGIWFCGRIEDHPQVPVCRARTVAAVRQQLSTALTASLMPEQPSA
jgi:hypothetical protein